MSFSRWLRNWHLGSAARRSPPARQRCRPRLEPLEDRLCPSYTVIDLGPGSYHPHALNEAGQVVGDDGNRAFLWENGVMTDLGTLGAAEPTSNAYDINDSGQVVGASGEDLFSGGGDPLPPYRNFLWENGVMTEIFLGAPELAINNAGQIVGGGPVVLEDGEYVLLPAAAAAGFSAHDINDNGQIVSGTLQLLLLTDDDGIFANGGAVLTNLGYNAWGYYSRLNNCGQVIAGYSLYSNGVTTNLGFFGNGINDAGQVVGSDYATQGNDHAFLWQNGQTTDLNNLINSSSGWILNNASDINELGDIVGTGTIGGEIHGFLLIESSTPAPATLTVGDATVTEGNTGTRPANFIVTLSAASSQAVTVAYATANGTATAGSDYQAASGTLTIPAGQTTGTITVLVNGDRLGEPDEAFVVNLSAPTNATIADGQGIGTILDDEPRISINDVTVTEGNTGAVNATFTVSLSVAYDVAVTVHYQTANGSATAGSDYAAASGDVIIAAGQTTQTFTVAVIGDRSAEPTENFVVNLSAATNGLIVDSQGVGAILDNEPRISISDVTKSEGRKGRTTLFTFTVTLSAAYDEPVTMSYRTVNGTATTSDNDYIAKTGTLTFAPGETTKTITIEVKGDGKKEANETLYLDLFGNSGNSLFTKNRGLGTILNDD